MKTLHLGPEELLVAAKIAVAPTRHARPRWPRTIDAAEARVREAVPIARVIYLEPDIDRADRRRTPPTARPCAHDRAFDLGVARRLGGRSDEE